jgi:uncharacterized protein YjbJ (UPF0337 family)
MINENIAQGKWTEFKGEIQKKWGQLTDDDFDKTKGDITKLTGIIQKKYGETQEAIRTTLNSFVSSTKKKD